MTSGWEGLQSWKRLYLAVNVTEGNNVLSHLTLMDLPTICPVPPLTRETTACKAAALSEHSLLVSLQPRAPTRPRVWHINLKSDHWVISIIGLLAPFD